MGYEKVISSALLSLDFRGLMASLNKVLIPSKHKRVRFLVHDNRKKQTVFPHRKTVCFLLLKILTSRDDPLSDNRDQSQ